VFGLVLFYGCFRRLVSSRVALLAVLLFSLNLGDMFWSQSIRYYKLVVVFPLLSLYWFISGFVQGSYFKLLLFNGAFVLALWIHSSAVLLSRVLIVYLMLMVWGRQQGGAYHWKGYLFFGLPLLAVLSNGAFVLALWTRFSAVLLAPVFIAYLMLMVWDRQQGG